MEGFINLYKETGKTMQKCDEIHNFYNKFIENIN